MDKQEIENWQKVKEALEEAGKTDCFFYKRAVLICAGGSDPLEDVSSNTSHSLSFSPLGPC